MSKTLNAILAVARERISGIAPSAGRNTGDREVPNKLGDKPAVDYAPKAGDERKFAGKHGIVKQEYPYGNKALFTGEKIAYSLTTPAAKHMGNTLDQAVKAYEEVEVDEAKDKDELSDSAKKIAASIKNKQGKPSKSEESRRKRFIDWDKTDLGKIKPSKETKEEVEVDEGRSDVDKAHDEVYGKDNDNRNQAEFDAGQKPQRFKYKGRGMKGPAKADPKGVAGKGKNMGEDIEIDEASEKKLDAYRKKAHDQRSASNNPTERKDKNRHKGVHRAFDKLTGRAKVNATKEEVEVDEASRALPPGFKNKGWNRSLGSGKKKSGAGTPDDPEYERQNKPSGEGTSADPEYARQRKETREEIEIEEMWKATQGEDGKHVLKHAKTGQVSKKSFESKGEAIEAAVRLNRQNNHFKEDTLVEISKGKAARYITQAHNQGANARSRADAAARDRDTEREKKNDRKDDKRSAGISIAAAKLSGSAKVNAKEEVEQVDEISKKLAHRYMKKADAASQHHSREAQSLHKARDASLKDGGATRKTAGLLKAAQGHQDVAAKRSMGAHKAASKLTPGHHWQKVKATEEVEQIDEFSIHLKHPGALTRKAKKAGESNSAYEQDHKNDKGLSGKQARFAINAKKWHHEEKELTPLTQTQIDDVIEAAVLCDKRSLGKKMGYHKKKLKSEDIGSPKFKHHQRQAHIIKGMLEDKEEE